MGVRHQLDRIGLGNPAKKGDAIIDRLTFWQAIPGVCVLDRLQLAIAGGWDGQRAGLATSAVSGRVPFLAIFLVEPKIGFAISYHSQWRGKWF